MPLNNSPKCFCYCIKSSINLHFYFVYRAKFWPYIRSTHGFNDFFKVVCKVVFIRTLTLPSNCDTFGFNSPFPAVDNCPRSKIELETLSQQFLNSLGVFVGGWGGRERQCCNPQDHNYAREREVLLTCSQCRPPQGPLNLEMS